MIPPLTTIQMSQTELARLAFKALLTEVEREEPNPSGTEYFLDTALILRKSTALAPKSSRSKDATGGRRSVAEGAESH
jgi:DNA-binding LacI/PurR family transcriptional regulator